MSKAYAVVVPVEGDVRVIEWPDDDQLDVMYQEIGCTSVDLVRLPDEGVDMWVDDEGLLKAEQSLNLRASELAKRPIVGTALLTPYTSGPDSPGFNEYQATELSKKWKAGYSLEQVASLFGITRDRVRQIKDSKGDS